MGEVLVSCEGLKKYFHASGKGFIREGDVIKAVDGVSFDIYQQETLALVGESGCGKSTLGRLLIHLVEPTEGAVSFKGQNIFDLKKQQGRDMRKNFQIVFQDPYASLNPRMKVARIIAEPLETHGMAKGLERENRVAELMDLVGLRREDMGKYPHQFSGGQRQRIAIARALALNPALIICDEPVSALDVSIQAQILNLLKDLQRDMGLTYLFISHDLSVVRYIADRICVMFLGKIMELGSRKEIFEKPLHPYTKFLIGAVPIPDPKMRNREKLILEGDIPSPIHIPEGCRFHIRCPYAQEICRMEEPKMTCLQGRQFACHFPLQ